MATLNFSRLSWYTQIGLFVIVAAAGTAAFWNFYAQPAQAKLDEQRATLEAMKKEIANGQRTARNLPAFREEVADLDLQLKQLSERLPEEQDVAELLRRVQGMATEARLAIRGFKPQPVTNQLLHAEWPIGLELEGTYHDLGAFLERVSQFPRIINVGNIRIGATDGQTAASTITVACTATTFVLIDPKAEPDDPKASKKSKKKSAKEAKKS
jgi:type IV pilus assembly protein PilO